MAPSASRFIVVIEDEPDIRLAMATLLEFWGHHVVTAEDGPNALHQLADVATRPDLIIADFRLRGTETGLQAIEALQQEYNDTIPAILITGDTAPERLIEASESGHQVLHKPVSDGRLRATIANILAANTT